jgi:hypothetical protein
MKREIRASDIRGGGIVRRTRAKACRFFLEKIGACEHALPLAPLYKDLVCRGTSGKCPVYRLKSGAPHGPGDSRPHEEDRRRGGSLCPAA